MAYGGLQRQAHDFDVRVQRYAKGYVCSDLMERLR